MYTTNYTCVSNSAINKFAGFSIAQAKNSQGLFLIKSADVENISSFLSLNRFENGWLVYNFTENTDDSPRLGCIDLINVNQNPNLRYSIFISQDGTIKKSSLFLLPLSECNILYELGVDTLPVINLNNHDRFVFYLPENMSYGSFSNITCEAIPDKLSLKHRASDGYNAIFSTNNICVGEYQITAGNAPDRLYTSMGSVYIGAIPVSGISVIKTINGLKRLCSLRNSRINVNGLKSFGTYSGIRYSGNLYVLKRDGEL